MSITRYKDSLRTPFKERKYLYNQTFVKVYGVGNFKRIKVETLSICRNSGIEDEEQSRKGLINTEKLDCNIYRAKSKIFEYAFCNEWDYFFTGTLNGNMYDRTDLEKFHKDITQFMRDQRKKYGADIQFLLIPERHEDLKSWHMHGFIKGIPIEALHRFKIGDKMGKKLAEKVKRGDEVYKWIDYDRKFGFCDLEPIKNHEAVSKYITKYVTKELGSLVHDINAHMYYCSRGLNNAALKKKGTITKPLAIEPYSQYHNDHVDISWYEYSDEKLNQIISCIDEYSI